MAARLYGDPGAATATVTPAEIVIGISNAYLDRNYPRLDRIRRATVESVPK